MGRKRFLSTDMSGNPKIAAAGAIDTVAALSYGLLVLHMDDWGRRRADVRELKLNVFQALPHVDTPDIERILSILADERVRLLVLYEVGGRQYIQCEPESFYETQTYIKAVAKQRDSSKCPPPQGHPWADYWPESDWRKPTGNPTELHSVQKSALGAESSGELQPVQKSAPSVLHLSSPLPTSPHQEEEEGAPAGEFETGEPDQPEPAPSRVDAKGALWYEHVEQRMAHLGEHDKSRVEMVRLKHGMDHSLIIALFEWALVEAKRNVYGLMCQEGAKIGAVGIRTVEAWERYRESLAAKEQERQSRGAPQGKSGKPAKSNVFFTSGEKKDKDYYAHIYKKFEDGPPDPSGGDPPPDNGRESA